MPRNINERESMPAPYTPSKREKYSNYTPRKRYSKEQPEHGQYQTSLLGEAHGSTSPLRQQQPEGFLQHSNYRQFSNSRRKYQPTSTIEEEPVLSIYKPRELKAQEVVQDTYEIPAVL